LHTLGILRLDGRRQIAVTTRYVSTFFDVYLKGEPASELKSQLEYPEIEYVIEWVVPTAREESAERSELTGYFCVPVLVYRA
jgi:hypothetical protein